MRLTLGRKIGLLLLIPFSLSLIGTGYLVRHLENTSGDFQVVNIAGRQRLLSAEIRDWMNMVSIGQEEDRSGLLSRVEVFDRTLAVLTHGGEIGAARIPLAPPEIQGALDSTTALWSALKPDLLTIARTPISLPDFRRAYGRAEPRMIELRERSDAVVSAFEALYHTRRRQLLWILAAIMGLNFMVFLAGLLLTRRGIVKPVLRLAEAARRVQEGDYSQRLESSAGDELSTLGKAFNLMAEHLERLVSALILRRRHAETLIANVPSGLVALSADLAVIRCNRFFCGMFVLNEREIVGRLITEVLPISALAEAARAVLADGETRHRLPMEVAGADGVKRPLRITLVRTVLAQEGEGERLLIVVEDLSADERLIAQRDRAEERRDLLLQAIEQSGNVVLITDTQGQIEYANAQFTRLTGYSLDEVIGRKPNILKSGETPPAAYAELWKTILAGKDWHGTFHNRKKNGELYWASVVMSPVLGPDGVISNFIAIQEDISESRQAREQISSDRERFRVLFNDSRDALMTLEPPSWSFTSGNPAAVNMFRAKDENDFISYGPPDMSPERQPDGRPSAGKAKELIGAAMRAGSSFFEWKHKRLDGEEFWADVLLTRMRIGGETSLMATVRDISARKQAEAELQASQEQFFQSQKLEATGKLAGGIAHDFNNLLTSILGCADFASEGLPEGDPRLEDLEEIKKSGNRAAELTRQLLAFSRKQVLNPKVLDLNGVIEDIQKLLRRTISEQIEITLKLAATLSRVKADESQLGQVLLNLAVNANDAMPGGGTLLIESADAEFPEPVEHAGVAIPAGSYATFSVSDSGQGISKEILKNIFEPFFTTKGPGKGTGLGLATVYGIVKQSDGFITVYSEAGHGSTFRVFLPATPETPTDAARTAAAPEIPRGCESILLAEDDPRVRRISLRILENCGYTVLEAAGGEAALELLKRRKNPVQLLLTDLVMPGIDGGELARRARAECPGLKVIFTSGYPGEIIAKRGNFISGENFISKPFSPAALASLVRTVLDSPLPGSQVLR